MKSIKQQYIDLKEGRMSQNNFMRSLRMTLPQYVTNVTSFGDAVKILRNKGILNENLIKQLEKGIEVEKEHTKDEIKAAEIALDHLKEDDKYYDKLAKAGLEEENKDDDAETQAMIDKIEQEMADAYTTGGEQFPIKEAKAKWENTSGKEMYAQFKEIDNLNGQEVLIGIDYEIENNHELSKEEAIKLVLKNLKKNPIYYTATLMAGKEMIEIPTIGKLIPGSDQMKPLKSEADLVDKDNGMKPVKGVEKAKASANKASKETNKSVKGVSLMSLIAKTVRGVQKMTATGEKMKIVKEGQENYYQTNVRLKPEEQKKIKSVLLDAEFEWDEDDRKQVVYSKKSEKEIQNVVDNVTGMATPSFGPKQSGVAKFLTKEDLAEMVREVLAEMESADEVTADIALGMEETMDGRDNLTDTAGHQLDENK